MSRVLLDSPGWSCLKATIKVALAMSSKRNQCHWESISMGRAHIVVQAAKVFAGSRAVVFLCTHLCCRYWVFCDVVRLNIVAGECGGQLAHLCVKESL